MLRSIENTDIDKRPTMKTSKSITNLTAFIEQSRLKENKMRRVNSKSKILPDRKAKNIYLH